MRGPALGADGEEILDLDSWFAHAPPEKGAAQWRDGYSAKEQAKAWLRTGAPAVPDELWEALAEIPLGEVQEVFGRPEHRTRLDDYGRERQHDLFACARHQGSTRFVVGVGASVYVLLPKSEKFIFAVVGSGLYLGLYDVKDDLAEVYRRLAYDLDRFWDANDQEMQKLFASFRLAAAGLAVEIVVVIAMVSDNLF